MRRRPFHVGARRSFVSATPVAVAGQIPVSCQTPPCTAYGIGRIWTDQLDTPRAITNEAGTLVWNWDSAPFGDTQPDENPGGLGPFEFNPRFPGQYFDKFSGLHQNGLRVYDPLLGRYLQSDPIGLAGGIDTYTYANGNPVAYSDPTGQCGVACDVAIFFTIGVASNVIGSWVAQTPVRMSDMMIGGLTATITLAAAPGVVFGEVGSALKGSAGALLAGIGETITNAGLHLIHIPPLISPTPRQKSPPPPSSKTPCP